METVFLNFGLRRRSGGGTPDHFEYFESASQKSPVWNCCCALSFGLLKQSLALVTSVLTKPLQNIPPSLDLCRPGCSNSKKQEKLKAIWGTTSRCCIPSRAQIWQPLAPSLSLCSLSGWAQIHYYLFLRNIVHGFAVWQHILLHVEWRPTKDGIEHALARLICKPRWYLPSLLDKSSLSGSSTSWSWSMACRSKIADWLCLCGNCLFHLGFVKKPFRHSLSSIGSLKNWNWMVSPLVKSLNLWFFQCNWSLCSP